MGSIPNPTTENTSRENVNPIEGSNPKFLNIKTAIPSLKPNPDKVTGIFPNKARIGRLKDKIQGKEESMDFKIIKYKTIFRL